MLEARFVEAVTEIPQAAWDALVGADSPFNEWTFLRACEEASSVPQFGVLPRHLTMWDDDELVAIAPLYIKGDGRAEFIYDYGWYQLAHQVGIEYYPKLVSMSPFTPVTSQHFYVAPGWDRTKMMKLMLDVIEGWARESGMHGVHFLFIGEEESKLLCELGYLSRVTFQLSLTNEYRTFDEFLMRFKSRDRIKLKRDMRLVADQDVEIRCVEGDAITEDDFEAIYEFYSRTCAYHGTGSHYLQRGTWERLFRDWRDRIVLFMAYHAGNRIGGSMCVHKGNALYGRYWGCRGEWPSLYFNLAFYEPTKLTIERGWRHFYVGFGNTHYKHSRGFDPALTLSCHKFFDSRLHDVLSRTLVDERRRVLEHMAEVQAHSKLRPRP